MYVYMYMRPGKTEIYSHHGAHTTRPGTCVCVCAVDKVHRIGFRLTTTYTRGSPGRDNNNNNKQTSKAAKSVTTRMLS